MAREIYSGQNATLSEWARLIPSTEKTRQIIVDDLNDPKIDPTRLKARREAFEHHADWQLSASSLDLMGKGSPYSQDDVDKSVFENSLLRVP
jgi:hypothetical protein